MKKTYIFLYSLVYIFCFNISSTDRNSLGFLSFDDETIELILKKIIHSKNDSSSIANFGSNTRCITKTIQHLATINKFAHTLLNNTQMTTKLVKELATRFEFSAEEAMAALNTAGTRSLLIEKLIQNGEYTTFENFHEFYTNLQQFFFPLFSDPLNLTTFEQKTSQGIRFNELNGELETPWGTINIFPDKQLVKKQNEIIKRFAIAHFYQFGCFSVDNCHARPDSVNKYIWQVLKLSNPKSLKRQLPENSNQLLFDDLPEWIAAKVQRKSFKENSNTLVIEPLDYFTLIALGDLFGISQPHFPQNCRLTQRLTGKPGVTYELVFEKDIDLANHFRSYYKGIKDIQDGWRFIKLASYPNIQSRIKRYSEKEWYLFAKRQELFHSSLIHHCIGAFNLREKMHCEHIFEKKYARHHHEHSYAFCWIKKDAFDEIVCRFNFNIDHPTADTSNNISLDTIEALPK